MAIIGPKDVEDILGRDYDFERRPSLMPYINAADVIVQRVSVCAARRNHALTQAELQVIEAWVAAHYYACSDQPFKSKTTEGASANFQGDTGKYLEGTKYGQTALRLDTSGCLEAYDKRKVVRGFYAGGRGNDDTVSAIPDDD